MLRTPLVVGALVLLAAAVVLVVMLAQGGGDSSSSSAGSATKPTETATTPAPPPTLHNPSVTVTDRPRGETTAPPTLPAGGENPREYAVGDNVVRDHRSGDHKPLDVPPNLHPNDSRMIPSELTHSISQKVKAVMKDCVASLPKDGRGEKPRLEGLIVIAIKDQTLAVTQSTIQMRDLDGLGAATEAAKQCVESHAVGLSTPAPGEADLPSYSIHLSFAIP
jgi:hypothetical protein